MTNIQILSLAVIASLSWVAGAFAGSAYTRALVSRYLLNVAKHLPEDFDKLAEKLKPEALDNASKMQVARAYMRSAGVNVLTADLSCYILHEDPPAKKEDADDG